MSTTNDRSPAALARERELWEAYRAGTRETLETLIHPLALDVGAGGPLDREGVLSTLGNMVIGGYAIDDLRVRRFGDIEIVTYKSTVDGSYKGLPFPAREVNATTVWLCSGDTWRVVHRHESPARRRGN